MRCIFGLANSTVIEITKARDPNKTVISLIEKNNIYGCYIKRAEVRRSTDKRVLIFVTLSAKTDPASDPLALRPDASDASPASHASCAS